MNNSDSDTLQVIKNLLDTNPKMACQLIISNNIVLLDPKHMPRVGFKRDFLGGGVCQICGEIIVFNTPKPCFFQKVNNEWLLWHASRPCFPAHLRNIMETNKSFQEWKHK